MKHFGSLLKRIRGGVSLREIEGRTGLSHSYLSKLERGARTPPEERARQILRDAFGMSDREIERALIEVSLEDHGLKEEEIRHLVVDLIQEAAPRRVRRQIIALYRGYVQKGRGIRSSP